MEWANVRAPARLHLGFIAERAGALGSAAIAIEEPYLLLDIRKSGEIKAYGDYSTEFEQLAERLLSSFVQGNGAEIWVKRAIKRHVGLGSGTRMAMAVGTALSYLYRIDINPYRIAEFFGRGRNSKAGLETLLHGGMAVVNSSGQGINTALPEDWRFIVAIPEIEHGFFGEKERKAMDSMGMPVVGEDIRDSIMDALSSEDIELFGRLLTELDEGTGAMFTHVQPGTHTFSLLDKIKEIGLKKGALGAGQSSWGPALYFLSDSDKAERIASSIEEYILRNGGGEVFVSKAADKGIEIFEYEENIYETHGIGESHRILYKS